MSDINQIIVGSILGDGSLSPLTKRNKYSTLDISQHESKLPYLRWLYDQLTKKFELNPIYQKKGFENQYRFRSKPNKTLGIFRSKFYDNLTGCKIIPKDIGDLLKNPISLAVWYMDDGTLDKRYKYHLNSSIATCVTFWLYWGSAERLASGPGPAGPGGPGTSARPRPPTIRGMLTLSGGTITTVRTSSLPMGRILTVNRPKYMSTPRRAWKSRVTMRPMARSRRDGPRLSP
ncbi:MAG: hypothetical protein UR24_C0002G0001, partial [Candidatus Woesebacteria bacterium GW2011_GWF2_32_16]